MLWDQSALSAAIAAAEAQRWSERQHSAATDVAAWAISVLHSDPSELIRHFPPESRVGRVIRAAVAGHTTDEDAAVAQMQMTQALLASVRFGSFFDRIAADALPGRLHARVGLILHNPHAGEVIEGHAKPIGKMIASAESIAAHTVAAIVGVSRDLLRFGSPGLEELMRRSLGQSLVTAQDDIVLPILGSGAVAYPATGADAVGVRHDLRRAAELLSIGIDSRLHLAVGPLVARRLALMPTLSGDAAFPEMTPAGGRIDGIVVTPSETLTDTAVLVDASAFAADAGGLELTRAENASIEMSSTPTQDTAAGSPPAPVASEVVSLFQTNSLALRAVRLIGLVAVRPGGVVVIQGAGAWGLEGSPPS